MSFGFSNGDFLTFGQLVWKTIDRCRSSAAEFKDLSREVSSLHFVLKAIENYWREHDLGPNERYELFNLVEGCREVLKDLGQRLDKYQKLGSKMWKSPIGRIRWAAKDIAPIRTKLLRNALYLSTFNTTLAQSSNNDRIRTTEARILQRLNEMQLDFEEGRREVPAFSSITIRTVSEDTMRTVTGELESTGISSESISSSQAFIRSWIDQVVLAEHHTASQTSSQNPTTIRRDPRTAPSDETDSRERIQRHSNQPDNGPHATRNKVNEVRDIQAQTPQQRMRSRSRARVWIPVGAAFVCLIIIVIVVGVLYGKRDSHSAAHPTSSPTPASSHIHTLTITSASLSSHTLSPITVPEAATACTDCRLSGGAISGIVIGVLTGLILLLLLCACLCFKGLLHAILALFWHQSEKKATRIDVK
ncbi:MAG: hypothetical protein Q9226_004067 [Calogaya cf. arnoldii]